MYSRTSDAGPLDSHGPIVLDACENCGAGCEFLIHLDSWGFRACPACAREVRRRGPGRAADRRTERSGLRGRAGGGVTCRGNYPL